MNATPQNDLTLPYVTRTLMLGFLLSLPVVAPQSAPACDRQCVLMELASATSAQPASLVNRELTHIDLAGIDFKGANLRSVDFSGSDLHNADLSGTNMDLARMVDTDLRGANLNHASMFSVVLEGANLTGATLRQTRLIGNTTKARFKGADLAGLKGGADMRNQSMGLMNAVMSRANFINADLRGADLAHANLQFTDFTGADLRDAKLTDADLRGADLTRARLANADLTHAKIADAIFKSIQGRDALQGLDTTEGRQRAQFDDVDG